MTYKVGNRRLLKLAKFLREKVPPEKFDLDCYIGDIKEIGDRAHISLECNTTACALGWATAVWPKSFQFVSKERVLNDIGLDFFNLDFEDWDHLFAPYTRRTPKQEAAVIERFVQKREEGTHAIG